MTTVTSKDLMGSMRIRWPNGCSFRQAGYGNELSRPEGTTLSSPKPPAHILLHSQVFLFIYLADHVLIETLLCSRHWEGLMLFWWAKAGEFLHSTTSKSGRKRQLSERSTPAWKCTCKSYGAELQDKRAYGWAIWPDYEGQGRKISLRQWCMI